MKRIIALVMVLGSMNLMAQQTASTSESMGSSATNNSQMSVKDFADTLARSPWGLRLDTESFTQRETKNNNVDYVESNLYPAISYSLTADDIFYVYPQLIMTKSAEKNAYEVRDDYIALRYDKLKILSEESNGIDFSISSRYYTLASNKARYRNEAYGLINQRLYFTKKLNERFTLQNENRFYFYQTNSTYSTATSNNYMHILYLTPVYQLSNSLSSYVELKQMTTHGRRATSDDLLRVKPGLDYKVSDKLTAGIAFMNHPIDGRKGKKKSTVIENELSLVYGFTPNAQMSLFLTSNVLDTDNSTRNYRNTFNDSVEFEMDLVLKAF